MLGKLRRPTVQSEKTVQLAQSTNCTKVSLPQSLRDLFPISSDQFRKHLKTSLFIGEDTDPGRERL